MKERPHGFISPSAAYNGAVKNGMVKVEQRVLALEEALKEAVRPGGFEGAYRPSATPPLPPKATPQGQQAR